MSTSRPTFSIVIPVYNEVESLDELVGAVDAAMVSMRADYEIVFVDDGSTDGSFEKLKALAASRPSVRLFSFRRNLGKSPALTCGFQKAEAEFIVTLDADLQDDPRDIVANSVGALIGVVVALVVTWPAAIRRARERRRMQARAA